MEKLRNCGLWEKKKKKTKLWPLEEERKTKGARAVSLPRECIFNLFIKLKLKCRKKVFPFLLLTTISVLGQGDRRQSVSITVFLYKLFIYNNICITLTCGNLKALLTCRPTNISIDRKAGFRSN